MRKDPANNEISELQESLRQAFNDAPLATNQSQMPIILGNTSDDLSATNLTTRGGWTIVSTSIDRDMDYEPRMTKIQETWQHVAPIGLQWGLIIFIVFTSLFMLALFNETVENIVNTWRSKENEIPEVEDQTGE